VKIVGYTDPLCVRAGERIQFKISSEEGYHVQVVRLIHGDTNPKGPGFKAEDVDATVNGIRTGQWRDLPSGSYIELERDEPLRRLRSLTLSAWVFPTLMKEAPQAIMGAWGRPGPGYCLLVEDGRLRFVFRTHAGGEHAVGLAQPLLEREWQFVAASLDLERQQAVVMQHRRAHFSFDYVDDHALVTLEGLEQLGLVESPFLIAAHAAAPGELRAASAHYNGKLESPAVHAVGKTPEELRSLVADNSRGETVAAWDFSALQTTRRVVDRSRNGLGGRTVNLPTRGVTGRKWDGSVVDFERRPELYAAIHFHDDDLDDARWPTDFEWEIPETMRSGIYAARCATEGGAVDYVPFFVRPAATADRAAVLVLIPTFSYLAYANDHNARDPELRASLEIPDDFVYPAQDEDRYILDTGLTGMYDLHTDGSAVVYSSRLRPVVNMRPAYRQPLLNNGYGGPHQLAADLHLIDWLEHFDYAYDVATDEDLHHSGRECLNGYRVVLTGTHPEYWSGQALDALEAYLGSGGRLMYLGGNGFYWVTSVEPEEQHTIEVRKWGGTAAFEVPVGEVFNSTTGELGGLWRFRGRFPQRLVGVGMTAQAVAAGAPYERLPESHDPRVSFIFDGVGADERIGDHESLVNEYGAGGYEVDRWDPALGSPQHALRLATTVGLSDRYQHVREEIMLSDSRQSASVNPKVRADMVYFEGRNGSAVFSVGSIAWCGSLSFNGYENAVSRITRNVLNRFTAA
jgi:N,N-dimethylformamidase